MAEAGEVQNENFNMPNFSNIVGKLKFFNGKSNFKSFLNQFNTRAKLEGWREEVKVNILKCLCIDSAQTYLNSHPETEEFDFDELVEFLTKRYEIKVSKQEAYGRFSNIKQGHSNVRDYADKIDEISESVMHVLTEFEDIENRDQFLISIFVNGLNLEIKKLIGIQEFNSYNNCLQTALKAEKLLPSRNPIFNVNNESEQSNNFPNYKSSPNPYNNNNRVRSYNNDIICFHCNRKGHIKRSCPQINRRYTLMQNPPKNY